jgi:tetratricopeptide (TPR) repeat protein
VAQQTQPTITLEEALQMAYRHHQAGELAQAKHIYERILSAVPQQPAALSMLASVAYLEGDEIQAEAYRDQALKSYSAVLQQQPGQLGIRAALVNQLLAADRVQEARELIEDLQLPLNPLRAKPEAFQRRREAARKNGLPPIIINTIPKSASESIWNRLAQGLGMAQCHLSIGLFPHCTAVPHRLDEFGQGGIISKEHIAPSPFNVEVLHRAGVRKLVVHLRDPRQTTLSWAHFVRDDISKTLLGPLWRQSCPPADVLNADLSQQLDWCIDNYLPLAVDFMRGWQEIAAEPARPIDILFQTFESFRTEPDAYFARTLDFYGIDKSFFAEDAEAEVVHLRKGALDEWREVYADEQQRRANAIVGPDLLDAFGWTA